MLGLHIIQFFNAVNAYIHYSSILFISTFIEHTYLFYIITCLRNKCICYLHYFIIKLFIYFYRSSDFIHTVELPYNEGPREWQKLFTLKRFVYFEVIFHIFTITGVPVKKNHSLYRGLLRYIEVSRYIEVPQPSPVKRDGVWKVRFNFAACFPYVEVYIWSYMCYHSLRQERIFCDKYNVYFSILFK